MAAQRTPHPGPSLYTPHPRPLSRRQGERGPRLRGRGGEGGRRRGSARPCILALCRFAVSRQEHKARERQPAVSRASGILLHPTSLPGPHGIGDVGPVAYRFVDFLVAAGQTYWQILPHGPTGYGDSPYQTFSAFAGNPLLISPEMLVKDGLLPPAALDRVPLFPAAQVDYGAVIAYKTGLLVRAFTSFEEHASPHRRADVERFAAAQQSWLDDFAF